MEKQSRINLTKDQIRDKIKHEQKVAHMKEIVRKIFPLLKVPTIYDGQTTLNALVGFIKADMEEKLDKMKLSEIDIDLSKEKDNEIKTAMLAIIELMKDEPADQLSQTLDRLSQVFGKYGENKFVKNPMDSLKLEEILAD